MLIYSDPAKEEEARSRTRSDRVKSQRRRSKNELLRMRLCLRARSDSSGVVGRGRGKAGIESLAGHFRLRPRGGTKRIWWPVVGGGDGEIGRAHV